MLIWWDSFFVLDFGFYIFNGISWLNIEGDSFSSEGLDEDLHTTTESEDQVEGGLLLDVVVLEGSVVFELFAGKDESLLIRWDAFFVLDLCLDILNGVC